MRQVLSLSLPQEMAKKISQQAKRRGHASVSGYVQYLFSLDENLISAEELFKAADEARKEYKAGNTARAKSIADLV
ncbi:MAG: hypothetical protein ABIA47_02160 [bacterium]